MSKHFLIPYMSDHSYVVQAALEHFGMESEVMPPADDVSATIGINLVLGKECTPCTYVVGDIIRRLRRNDLDPAQTVLFFSTAEGPCRYGQYHVLLRHILDEQGFADVEIFLPSSEYAYRGFGDHPLAFRQLAWRGIVALDLLLALLHHFRPYETCSGATDELYQRSLAQIVQAVQQGGGTLVRVLRAIGKGFRAMPVDRSRPRPQIGLVGEIFVRQHAISNQNVIRHIEALDGEIVLATLMEFLYYVNWWRTYLQRQRGKWVDAASLILADTYQRLAEFQLVWPVADLLVQRFESRSAQLMRHTARYMDPAISTEAVLSVGKAVELAHRGASGIVNVLPFTCMPGTITAGLSPRIRRDLHDIPWLDLSYDMQQNTNIQTRLEAFMYQAHHFQRHQLAATQ